MTHAQKNTHIPADQGAVLDSAHIGDIQGAFGSIARNDTGERTTLKQRLYTLLAILGPGLIVMVGDNDAGAFSTYGQAGQNYGTTLLWTIALLIPVIYVNQEMVLRLGAVTGVGHARLIFERFGRFWGAFSVIDLFLLNGLTIVTEFIGISMGLEYLGVSKIIGVAVASVLIMLAAGTGSFRRFERISMLLVFGSLLLIPILYMVHPPLTQVLSDFVIPKIADVPNGDLSAVILLVIAIVGTTVAPWQLFFQQSYLIDKRITPRFIRYERADLNLGIALVVIGAVCIIAFTAQIFAHRPEFGNFTDPKGIAVALGQDYGHLAGVLFAITLIDASIIGAMAVSLSTAYAIGDTLNVKHSLHRKPSDAPGFYAVYCGLIVLSAALVLIPGVPLGLLTNAVQSLAGVLLPSATVFLFILCNDSQVLGPWVNGRWTNLFTAVVILALVLLSIVLVVATVWTDISARVLMDILISGGVLALVLVIAMVALNRYEETYHGNDDEGELSLRHKKWSNAERNHWRMPPLEQLSPMVMSKSRLLWMAVLRVYLVVAVAVVAYKVIELAWH